MNLPFGKNSRSSSLTQNQLVDSRKTNKPKILNTLRESRSNPKPAGARQLKAIPVLRIKDLKDTQLLYDRKKVSFLKSLRQNELNTHFDIKKKVYLASLGQGNAHEALQSVFEYLHKQVPESKVVTDFLSGFIYAETEPFCESFHNFINKAALPTFDSKILLRDLVRQLQVFSLENETGGIFLDRQILFQNTVLKMKLNLFEKQQNDFKEATEQIKNLEPIMRLLRKEKFEFLKGLMTHQWTILGLQGTLRDALEAQERSTLETESLTFKIDETRTLLRHAVADNFSLTEKLKEKSALNEKILQEFLNVNQRLQSVGQDLKVAEKLIGTLAQKLVNAGKKGIEKGLRKIESLAENLESVCQIAEKIPIRRKGLVLYQNVPSLREKLPPRCESIPLLDRDSIERLLPEEREEFIELVLTTAENGEKIGVTNVPLIWNGLTLAQFKINTVLGVIGERHS